MYGYMFSIDERYQTYHTVLLPFANIGRMSGLPQDHVNRLSLNTESNSTGFSFQPEMVKLKTVNGYTLQKM